MASQVVQASIPDMQVKEAGLIRMHGYKHTKSTPALRWDAWLSYIMMGHNAYPLPCLCCGNQRVGDTGDSHFTNTNDETDIKRK